MISPHYACEQITIIYLPYNSEKNLPQKKKKRKIAFDYKSNVLFITTEKKLPI